MKLKEVCIQYLEELLVKIKMENAEMIDISVDREIRDLFLEGLVKNFIHTGVCTLKIRYKENKK